MNGKGQHREASIIIYVEAIIIYGKSENVNLQKLTELDFENNRIEIYDKDNNLLKVIEPYAVESCMNPGTFKITPIRIEKTKDSIVFISENIRTEIKKQDIESGDIEVKVSEFIPQRRKAKSNCTKCTNCGRCSW